MYASVVVWTLTPHTIDRVIEQTRQQILPVVERQPGFSVCYVVRSHRDAYVTVLIHQTREQAEAGHRALLPLLRRCQGELVTGMDRYAGQIELVSASGDAGPAAGERAPAPCSPFETRSTTTV